jgi:chromosomal replication initiation ATPase DnaA
MATNKQGAAHAGVEDFCVTDKGHVETTLTQAIVAHVTGVPMAELTSDSRREARTAFARQLAMYLAHITFGLTLKEVAEAFGRDRSTASYACHHIEDLRDDPGLDLFLTRLENFLRMAIDIEVSL